MQTQSQTHRRVLLASSYLKNGVQFSRAAGWGFVGTSGIVTAGAMLGAQGCSGAALAGETIQNINLQTTLSMAAREVGGLGWWVPRGVFLVAFVTPRSAAIRDCSTRVISIRRCGRWLDYQAARVVVLGGLDGVVMEMEVHGGWTYLY